MKRTEAILLLCLTLTACSNVESEEKMPSGIAEAPQKIDSRVTQLTGFQASDLSFYTEIENVASGVKHYVTEDGNVEITVQNMEDGIAIMSNSDSVNISGIVINQTSTSDQQIQEIMNTEDIVQIDTDTTMYKKYYSDYSITINVKDDVVTFVSYEYVDK